jgi:glycosyltransferase involved in cell wall biosynthesis
VPERSLRIAWVGAGPGHGDSGGVPGVATELLVGLAGRGHRIDCFLPSSGREIPDRVAAAENLEFVWGTSEWSWNRWYSRTKSAAFASGLASRGIASMRLRRELARRHAREPYDVVYSFSNIEAPGVPRAVARRVPLVIHPETHSAGELHFLIRERRLALRCQPAYALATAFVLMSFRSLVQRIRIRRARLLVCISSVFRENLVSDYGFPRERTIVVPNPVRVERFADLEPRPPAIPTVLVLGRVAVRKGVEDVVAVAQALHDSGSDTRMRVVGGPGLWSDYTKLLDDLPPDTAEYLGRIPPVRIPQEIAQCDVLLQASRYEPFALTVAEALAAGIPVVATSEVGAIEGVSRSVVSEVAPGDVQGMTAAITALIERVRSDPAPIRAEARAEVRRLFAADVVCGQISDALQALVGERTPSDV